MSPSERRKHLRLELAIPVRVQGFLADGSAWEEMTATEDVSAGGTCFPLGQPAELGQVLLLTLALPKRLRQYDLNEADYRVYSLVRAIRRRPDQLQVGVMFFGKYPPRGFTERPAARYLLPSDSYAGMPSPAGLREGAEPDLSAREDAATGPMDRLPGLVPPPLPRRPTEGVWLFPDASHPPSASTPVVPPPLPPPLPSSPEAASAPTPAPGGERRRSSRMELYVNFTLQEVDEWGAVLQEELTVADNISRGGVRVLTTHEFTVGDVVLLQEAGGGFATRAEVRGKSLSRDGITRLHLRFVDRQAPDRLLRQ